MHSSNGNSRQTILVRSLISLIVVALLDACGGGGGSDHSSAPSAASSATSTAGASASQSAQAQVQVANAASSVTSSSSSASSDASGTTSSATTVNASTAIAIAAKLKGVNLSGAEYNASNPLANLGWDYIYPTTAEIDYYATKGFTAIRLPFSGARLQPVNNGPLNATELGYINTIVTYCATKNISVILDPHDYGMKYDSSSGTMKVLGVSGGLPAADFADFWSRLAVAFKAQSNVVFGLMNEPYVQSTTQWQAVAQAAITAIRASGANQLILIPGTSYTGAHDWVSSGNAAAWRQVNDPANNFVFEMHQYLDSDDSGTHTTCVAGKGATVLASATAWARANGYRIFLGETGWSQDPSCVNEGPAIMNYTSANADVWAGWTYWSGGPWIPQSYMFMLDPISFILPIDQPQMQALVNNL